MAVPKRHLSKARRAILRSPISRMGYGGYLSLAAKFPKFVDTVTHIADEFRDIHDQAHRPRWREAAGRMDR